MRTLLIAAVAAMALVGSISESSAQRGWGGVGDGCGRDSYGRLVCRPGAEPGVPYYRGRGVGDGCGTDEYGRTFCRPGARPGVPYGYARQPEYGYYRRRPAVSDGCGTDEYGRTFCRPGAYPGVPYNRGGYYYDD